MPYRQIEQIHERKGEKVAFMLTAENMVGLLLGAMPLYLLSGSLPFWLRAALIGLGALIGVIATLEIAGLTPAERLMWLVRGFVRLRLQGARLSPEQMPGAAPLRREERALPLNGPIRVLVAGSGRTPQQAVGLSVNSSSPERALTAPVPAEVNNIPQDV